MTRSVADLTPERMRAVPRVTDSTTLCCSCEEVAVYLPDDPYCAACFAKVFDQCDNCGAWVREDEVGTREIYPATYLDPPEYDACCVRCAGPSDDPDNYDFDDRGEDE